MNALVCWPYSALRGGQNTQISPWQEVERGVVTGSMTQYSSPLALEKLYEQGADSSKESFAVEDSMMGLQEEKWPLNLLKDEQDSDGE